MRETDTKAKPRPCGKPPKVVKLKPGVSWVHLNPEKAKKLAKTTLTNDQRAILEWIIRKEQCTRSSSKRS